MKLCTLGVNHETAPVDIRETVAFSEENSMQAIIELKANALISECIILSTCNRTELYCILKDNIDESDVISWLHEYFNLSSESLSPYLYIYHELDAVKHIMRVASGLNSLVLGEPQIFGQIKDAYNSAHKAESVHQVLENLFQHIFKTVKQVRTDTAIGNSPISVAFSAVSLSKQFFGDLSQQTALLLGAGETAELVARHLKESKVGNMIIANRSFEKAHQLSETVSGYAIELREIEQHLHEADIVIGSTASPTPILLAESVKKALKKRKNRPMFMIDIAVPRDIESSTSDFNNVYLYTVDDLQKIIESNKQSRQNAALEAEEIITLQAESFYNQLNASEQIKPVIQAYRKQSMDIKQNTLEHALNQLEQGVDAEEIIKRLANQLTNRLLHTPTMLLNQAADEGNEPVIKAAKKLIIETDKSSSNKP